MKKYESFVAELRAIDETLNDRAKRGWRLASICPSAFSVDNKVLNYLVVMEHDHD